MIAWRARRGEHYDIALWKEVTLSVASTASSLGHDSELSWSLWLMKELGIKVGSRLSDKFISTSGPLVMSMLSHMVVHGLIGKASFLNDLQDIALGDEQLSGRYWPLTLELYHLGHNDRLEAHRSANNEPLSSYHANRATIIDWSRLPRAFDREEGDDGSGHWEPDFAIEDYASAYDGEDEEDLDSDMQFPDEDIGFFI